jgi:hypothetical protein
MEDEKLLYTIGEINSVNDWAGSERIYKMVW